MDKHHPIILLLSILLIVTLIGVTRGTEHVEQARDALAEERRIGAELFNQNQELVQANIKMRERLLELSDNLTIIEGNAQACFAQIPALQELANTSRATPRDRIDLGDVSFGETVVVIRADAATPGLIGPTGSMRPLLDNGTIVLELPVTSSADLYPGDIIIYERADGTRVIHRIIGLGQDKQGWYAITKGDSNPKPDPEKIRFHQVRGVVGGIIY